MQNAPNVALRKALDVTCKRREYCNRKIINFEYKKIAKTLKKVDNNEFELVGNLTMKGVAKGIKLDTEFGGYIKDGYGNEKAGFSINGTLNRKDFGLNWNSVLEAGGVTVGNEIKINAEVQFVKQSE